MSLPLLLLAPFHIMKEECRHLRLKPLPFCVWSPLSSLCLNWQWAQLGLCFQYPFSTLHVIRKENREQQSHLLPRPRSPPRMAGARSQRGGHRDPLFPSCMPRKLLPSVWPHIRIQPRNHPFAICVTMILSAASTSHRFSRRYPLHTKVSPRTKFFVFGLHPEKPDKSIWFVLEVKQQCLFLSIRDSMRFFQKTTILFRAHGSVERGLAIAFLVNFLTVFPQQRRC